MNESPIISLSPGWRSDRSPKPCWGSLWRPRRKAAVVAAAVVIVLSLSFRVRARARVCARTRPCVYGTAIAVRECWGQPFLSAPLQDVPAPESSRRRARPLGREDSGGQAEVLQHCCGSVQVICKELEHGRGRGRLRRVRRRARAAFSAASLSAQERLALSCAHFVVYIVEFPRLAAAWAVDVQRFSFRSERAPAGEKPPARRPMVGQLRPPARSRPPLLRRGASRDPAWPPCGPAQEPAEPDRGSSA